MKQNKKQCKWDSIGKSRMQFTICADGVMSCSIFKDLSWINDSTLENYSIMKKNRLYRIIWKFLPLSTSCFAMGWRLLAMTSHGHVNFDWNSMYMHVHFVVCIYNEVYMYIYRWMRRKLHKVKWGRHRSPEALSNRSLFYISTIHTASLQKSKFCNPTRLGLCFDSHVFDPTSWVCPLPVRFYCNQLPLRPLSLSVSLSRSTTRKRPRLMRAGARISTHVARDEKPCSRSRARCPHLYVLMDLVQSLDSETYRITLPILLIYVDARAATTFAH